MEFFQSSVSTTLLAHQQDMNKINGEKSRLELHKKIAGCFEQI